MTNGAGSVYSVDVMDKGMIQIPGKTKRDSERLHHAMQNNAQFSDLTLMDCLFLEFFI